MTECKFSRESSSSKLFSYREICSPDWGGLCTAAGLPTCRVQSIRVQLLKFVVQGSLCEIRPSWEGSVWSVTGLVKQIEEARQKLDRSNNMMTLPKFKMMHLPQGKKKDAIRDHAVQITHWKYFSTTLEFEPLVGSTYNRVLVHLKAFAWAYIQKSSIECTIKI